MSASSGVGRIGIFGGTFDPLHVGHLVIAEQVADVLGLERVLLVPSGRPPHKSAQSVQASALDRLAMVRAASAGNPLFVVESLEVETDGPMHSVDTVRALKERYGGSPERSQEWYFISGADAVADLLTWKQPDRLLEEVVMVAATRPGYDLSELGHLSEELENYHRIRPVECSRIDISATEIRARRRQGRSIRYMVPESVYEIIEERGIYETADQASVDGAAGQSSEQDERSESLKRSGIQ